MSLLLPAAASTTSRATSSPMPNPAGALTPGDYREHVMPHSTRVLAEAGELGVPRIHFGVGTSNLLSQMGEAGADVVGVDWRTPLASAIDQVGDRGVQGNLDPTLVFAPFRRQNPQPCRTHCPPWAPPVQRMKSSDFKHLLRSRPTS